GVHRNDRRRPSAALHDALRRSVTGRSTAAAVLRHAGGSRPRRSHAPSLSPAEQLPHMEPAAGSNPAGASPARRPPPARSQQPTAAAAGPTPDLAGAPSPAQPSPPA